MATVSFNRAAKAPAAAAPAPSENLPAVVEPMPVGAPAMASSQLEGEFTARDVAVPRLKLGQKTGAATDENPDLIGKWILDGAINLTNQVRIIVLRITKYQMEDLEYGSDTKPQIFHKHADAIAAGVLVKDVADIDLLVEIAPEADVPCATELCGKEYAPARYTVQSSAYGRTVGILMRDRLGWLKGDFASGCYTMDGIKKTDGKNSWFTPQLKADGAVSPELRAEIQSKFGV